MVSDARGPEVVYAAPARTGAWWVSLLGAAAFFAFVAWIVWRMVDHRGVALAALLLAAGALLGFGRSGPLRVRRVLVDHPSKTVVVTHATGTLRVPFGEITAASHGIELVGEGITLDVVTLTRAAGSPVRFAALDRAAAEGAARALRAALGLAEPARDQSPATS